MECSVRVRLLAQNSHIHYSRVFMSTALTDFMELGPSCEAAATELPSILCNTKDQYRVHKRPPLDPTSPF
jgi:hypothetical protein